MTKSQLPKIEEVNVKLLKKNPNNPRIIKDAKFKLLVKSIKDFPEMLRLRPIVVNESMLILGGNMRFRACLEAGRKTVWIQKASLTPEQEKEFIIKDNASFGEWDLDLIKNDWDTLQIAEWGIELPVKDFSKKNREIDINAMSDQMTLSLHYTADRYQKVKDFLKTIAPTPEQAVWQLYEKYAGK